MKNLKIESWIRTFIKDRNMYVLRQRRKDGKPGRALNVSYTVEGLKYTTDKYGTLIACKNAKTVLEKGNGGIAYLRIVGNMITPDNVVIEPFVPVDHTDMRTQSVEFVMVHRALKMLYAVDESTRDFKSNLELVYSDAAGI